MFITDSIHLFQRRNKREVSDSSDVREQGRRPSTATREDRQSDPEFVKAMQHTIKRFTEVV